MKKKKIVKTIGIILGVIILLVVFAAIGGSIYTGKLVAEGLLYQNKGNDTKSNSIKELENWNFDKEAFLETYAEVPVTFTAEDGNIVPAVIFDQNQSDRTVILIHGLGGEHVCMYPVAEPYLENGYNVLIIDQRASGDSQNEWISFGYFESLDIRAAVDYARNEMDAKTIVAHGQSMGGLSLVVYTATEHANTYLDAAILDSCISGMEFMFRGFWDDLEGTDGIPVDYVVACGDWYLKTFYGFDFSDLESTQLLKKNKIPTLMIYATDDELVPQEHADAMFDSIASTQKQISSFPCKHIESIIDCKQECTQVIMDFLDKNTVN